MAATKVSGNVFYVYILFRHDTAQPFYVGKGKGRRWEDHTMPSHAKVNPHKKAIIDKAKRANAEIPRVKVAEDLFEQEAFDLECLLIATIGRKINGGPLVNMSNGGEGQSGFFPTEATRKLISAASKKRVWPDDYSHAFVEIAFSKTGKKHTKASIEKVRLAKLGQKHSDASKALISAALRNRGPVSAETSQKLSAWQTGRKRTNDARQKMREGWARRNRALLERDQFNLFKE